MRTINLITHSPGKYRVSLDTVREFENAILSDPRVTRARVPPSRSYSLFRKIDDRLNLIPSRLLVKAHRENHFVVLMGDNFRPCLPYFYYRGEKSVYMFDVWPESHDSIREFVDAWGVDHFFVSSSQAAERLSRTGNRCRFHWIPEGIDAGIYKQYPYAAKNIDVLQFGRKHDLYHDLILGSLKERRKVYLYENIKGQIILPRREEFIDGLARTKISICFPSSATHPERSGDIETMTNRYLQSMVSKCLIVGHAPDEMIKLFGYNPVVEVDWNDAISQLEAILDTFDDYIPLIEKNYSKVHEHTWSRRWEEIARLISLT
jgi:hypothetical protein